MATMASRMVRAATVPSGLAVALLVAATLWGAGPVMAQALDDAGAADRLARLQVRLSALEEDIRAATGQVEDLGFRVRRMEERLETVLSDLESRLDRLEAGAAPGAPAAAVPPASPGVGAPAVPAVPSAPASRPGAAQPPAATAAQPPAAAAAQPPAAAAALPEGTPEQQYAYAYRLLQTAQYDQAEAALRAFLDRHSEADLADNARYWLAETYYVRSNFEAAARAFAAAYQARKDGSKAPDSLLKLGMSLAQIGRKDDACTTFAELKRAFPQAPKRIEDRRAAEVKRLGCP
jgi:tol-pal system protein YbgF